MLRKRAFCFNDTCRTYRYFLVLAPSPKAESVVPDSFKARRKRSKRNKSSASSASRRERIGIICMECGSKQVMLGCDHHPEWSYRMNSLKNHFSIQSPDPPEPEENDDFQLVAACGR